jgi:long-chain acyl-CoA synthetase
MAAWAEENGMAGADYADVVGSDAVQRMVGEYVEQLNARLNRWETIKRHVVLDQDLTVEAGELTPSMKVRRRAVEDRHRAQLPR